jgi:chromosome segregation ATPase
VNEKDRGEIDVLRREVAELRDALAREAAAAAAAAKTAELEAKLKEREGSLTRLMGTIKDHETTIRRLNEAVESWKRKYQFLSTEQPAAQKQANEK